MYLRICDSVLHFRCVESETVFLKEEPSELSTLSEDELTESTKVEVDNLDEQEGLHDMTEEMVNRLLIAQKVFGSQNVITYGSESAKQLGSCFFCTVPYYHSCENGKCLNFLH